MTWRETYWQYAIEDPGYFAVVDVATALDGADGTRMFSAWCKERYPYAAEPVRAAHYAIVLRTYPDDPERAMDTLYRNVHMPWDDKAMETTLFVISAVFSEAGIPAQVSNDDEFHALLAALLADASLYRMWQETLDEASVKLLHENPAVREFVQECRELSIEALAHDPDQPADDDPRWVENEGYDPGPANDYSGETVTVTNADDRQVRFSEPKEIAERRYPWLDYTFNLAVAFTLLPEANSTLSGTFTWDEAQAHLHQWGYDVNEVVEQLRTAIDDPIVNTYQDDRIRINVYGQHANITVTIGSAVHAHNSGIIATLDREGTYTHYVQFKDLVMFYTDESDMATPLYNVLKTFGDQWVGGSADSYVMRHGQGSGAYLVVNPVKVSHQESVAAEVRRCAGGMRVEILKAAPVRNG